MDWKLEDQLTSAMALTHDIQNRLIQRACKGRMSRGVKLEILLSLKRLTSTVGAMDTTGASKGYMIQQGQNAPCEVWDIVQNTKVKEGTHTECTRWIQEQTT